MNALKDKEIHDNRQIFTSEIDKCIDASIKKHKDFIKKSREIPIIEVYIRIGKTRSGRKTARMRNQKLEEK